MICILLVAGHGTVLEAQIKVRSVNVATERRQREEVQSSHLLSYQRYTAQSAELPQAIRRFSSALRAHWLFRPLCQTFR